MNKTNIMYIDDSQESIRLFELYFSKFNYSIRSFNNLESAFNSIAAGEPCDLVITDFYLNGETGEDVLLKIKAFNPNIKIAVMTGKSDLEWREIGFDDLLTKPMNLPAIKNQLTTLLDSCL